MPSPGDDLVRDCDICRRRHPRNLSCTDWTLIKPLLEALEWMGGSNDFSPGAPARRGWLRMVAPLLEKYGFRLPARRPLAKPDRPRAH